MSFIKWTNTKAYVIIQSQKTKRIRPMQVLIPKKEKYHAKEVLP